MLLPLRRRVLLAAIPILLLVPSTTPDGPVQVSAQSPAALCTVTQITDTLAKSPGVPSNYWPHISADGTRIVFSSDADLTGNNALRNFEVFFFDLQTSSFHQVTVTTNCHGYGCNGIEPSVSGDGNTIALQSQADFVGDNPNGTSQMFLFDVPTGQMQQVPLTAP